MHRGRSDTAANANANSDAPRKFASKFSGPISNREAANEAMRVNSLATPNGDANENAKNRSRCGNSLRMDVYAKFASDYECDGLVHSGVEKQGKPDHSIEMLEILEF